jgi:hypothetical protein
VDKREDIEQVEMSKNRDVETIEVTEHAEK